MLHFNGLLRKLNVHCDLHSCGTTKCKMDNSLDTKRKEDGRPFGRIMAWLHVDEHGHHRDKRQLSKLEAHDLRLAGRDHFAELMSGLADEDLELARRILAAERGVDDALDKDGEPLVSP